MTDNLLYIPIEKLHPHPDNPRKDVGDVSELAASIRESGVLQNLTVVPGDTDGEYTVIIGHRRLAACKLAGIKEVPCIVADMNDQEQFRTMMVENMQRSDLTVLEEADGFQLMMNMGDSVSDISQQTGLSDTTIRRRLSIGKLDRKKVIKGYERGATLQDYMELEKLDDMDTRNEVLKYIGTSDFKQKLKEAVTQQNNRKWLKNVVSYFRSCGWCSEISNVDYSKYQYAHNYGIWNKSSNKLEKPEDADEVKYFFKVCRDEVDLYSERRETKVKLSPEEKIVRKYSKSVKDLHDELTCIADECSDLREDFILDFGSFKMYADEVQQFCVTAVMYVMSSYSGYGSFSGILEDVANELNVKCKVSGYNLEIDHEDMMAAIEENPSKALLYLAFFMLDKGSGKTWSEDWNTYLNVYVPVYEKTKKMELMYQLLEKLGYQISEEEKNLLSGNLPQFQQIQDLLLKAKEEIESVKDETT